MNRQERDNNNLSHTNTTKESGGFLHNRPIQQEKDNNNERTGTPAGTQKKTSPVRAANDVDLMAFLHKKTERLTSVAYVLTSDLSDDEPLKSQIRRAHLALNAECMRTRYEPGRIQISLFYQYTGNLADCRYLVDLARIAGFLSDMNAELLRGEYNTLIEMLEGRARSHEPLKNLLLDPSFLAPPKALESSSDRAMQERYIAQFRGFDTQPRAPHDPSLLKDTTGTHKGQNRDTEGLNRSGRADVREGVSQKGQVKKTTGERNVKTKNARRATILKLLKQKSKRTIKDIAAHVEGCSEKTVQRELNALIRNGQITRRGKRRWSTYSLAQA